MLRSPFSLPIRRQRELYVEMLTRIVTQPLPVEAGDEKTALESVYSLFPVTRKVLRRHGRAAVNFTKIAVPVLNQIVRPFTAKWHREGLAGAFDDGGRCEEFRQDLASLQVDLRNYNRVLAELAGRGGHNRFGDCGRSIVVYQTHEAPRIHQLSPRGSGIQGLVRPRDGRRYCGRVG